MEGHMKDLSPKDASILAVIAENAGMSYERARALIDLADDLEEVRAVAQQLLNGSTANGSTGSTSAQASANALRLWVRENRAGRAMSATE
jgi:hypothetical protein